VAWKKVCKPYSEGGLGIRSLLSLNEASNLKVCWELLHSQDKWAQVLRSRVMRNGSHINHHIFSSIWSGIKLEFNTVIDNSQFLVGNGVGICFWKDKWCGNQAFVHSLQSHLLYGD
jgi:hypothetical protein